MLKKLSVVSAILIAFVLLVPGLSLAAKDHSQKPTLAWTQNINSQAPVVHGLAYGGALYAGGLYIDPGTLTPKWRIEKRNESAGDLVTGFAGNGVAISEVIGEVTAFAADDAGLFAAGIDITPGDDYEWRIEKRDLNTGALNADFGAGGVITDNPSAGDDVITAVVINGSNNSFYVVGYNYILGVIPQYQIERRDLRSGALIAEFGTAGVVTENPGSPAVPYSAALDSGGLYVGGVDSGGTGGAPEWRIEKRDLNYGGLLSGFGTGGVVTEYISGATSGADFLTSLAVNSSALYVTGVTNVGVGGNQSWRIEKRNTSTSELISDFGSGGVVSETPDASGGTPTSIVLDSTGLYVGGYIGQAFILDGFSVDSKGDVSVKSDPLVKVGVGNPSDLYWRVVKRDLTSGALSSNFFDSGVYTYNPNTTDSDYDEIFNIDIDDNGLYIFGMSNASRSEYAWVIQELQFPDAVEAAATSTATATPETLPETGADGSQSSSNLPIIAAIIPLILVVGSVLLMRSRTWV